jgi:hypothetical protein
MKRVLILLVAGTLVSGVAAYTAASARASAAAKHASPKATIPR